MSTQHTRNSTTRRYRDVFKRQVVEAIEQEGYARQDAPWYGCSQSRIHPWMKQCDKNHLLHKVVKIQTMDEASRIDEGNQQVGKLKEALGDAHIDQTMLERYCKQACQRLEVDPQQFKKNTTNSTNDECQEPRYNKHDRGGSLRGEGPRRTPGRYSQRGISPGSSFWSTEQAREAARQAVNLTTWIVHI